MEALTVVPAPAPVSKLRALAGTVRGKVAPVWKFSRTKINSLLLERDRASLERFTARVLETAQAHEVKGVKNGDPVYAALFMKLEERIDAFCTRWSIPTDQVLAQMPAIKELQDKTIAERPVPPGIKLLAALLGGGFSLVLLLFTFGVGSGIFEKGHQVAALLLHLH